MTFVAFLLQSWARLVRALGATSRSLADDLLVFAIGSGHQETVQRAYSATVAYLHTLGAKVAPAKCYLFSTSSDTRRYCKEKYWTHNLSMRDLGGQLNTVAGCWDPLSTPG